LEATVSEDALMRASDAEREQTVFVLRNIWRLHGPAPELERVQRELERPGRGLRHGRYPRHLP
jgi:hypothetical protein